MLRREFLARCAAWGIPTTACTGVGCGTLLHSERCGRPHSNDIDWKIVALDGLGLLLFFIPGVIAFAVDFSTGAIYLPAPEVSFQGHEPAAHGPLPPPSLNRVHVSRTDLVPDRIEQIVTHHLGHSILLGDSKTRISPLPSLDRFDDQCLSHHTNPNFGSPARTLLDRLRPG